MCGINKIKKIYIEVGSIHPLCYIIHARMPAKSPISDYFVNAEYAFPQWAKTIPAKALSRRAKFLFIEAILFVLVIIPKHADTLLIVLHAQNFLNSRDLRLRKAKGMMYTLQRNSVGCDANGCLNLHGGFFSMRNERSSNRHSICTL